MSLPALIGVTSLAAFSACVVWRTTWRRKRRARLSALPPCPNWDAILSRNAVYTHLSEPLKRRLAGMMHVFLDEKRIEGCGGLEMTDEIRVTIALQACVLLLGRTGRIFPRTQSVFVYPGTYAPDGLQMRDGLLAEPPPRLGEAWHRGPVVLAWDAASHALTGQQAEKSPVVHEFAHQLDDEDGQFDGTPVLRGRSSYAEWARVFHREFSALQRHVRRGLADVIDAYGATDPAEFFAVATETFFERPVALRREHPDLYRQLQRYYSLDPASWVVPDDQPECRPDDGRPAPGGAAGPP